VKWRSTHADGSAFIFPIFALTGNSTGVGGSTIAVADMDADGKGETILAGVVFNSSGVVVSGEGPNLIGGIGTNFSSIVADVNHDGKLDLVVGNAAYGMDGKPIWSNPTEPDGFPAIADLDLDGAPELVVATGSDLRVLDAKTGSLRAKIPFASAPGSPVIGDFDGSGKPGIAVQQNGAPCELHAYRFDEATLTDNWKYTFTSCSGSLTATAFDFNGDGIAEVIAHDDCRIVVLDGTTGEKRLSLAAPHATWTEFVSVADINGDGHADLLYSTNDGWGSPPGIPDPTRCNYTGEEAPTHGVFVFSDPDKKWMPTRRVWNQQSYHITNIKSDGTLPKGEVDSWGKGGWNTYRVSAQGKGATAAPDLVVSLGASLGNCPASLRLIAIVQNQGTAGVPADIEVDFYQGAPPSGVKLGSANTKLPLLPGASETVTLDVAGPLNPTSYYATIDEANNLAECGEDNNTGTLVRATCGTVR
jgi:hypothetical protein